MNQQETNELIDKAMAGRLSPNEKQLWEGLLRERPDLQADEELGRALRALPQPPPVSSNFTALVLQQINRPEAPAGIPAWLSWFRFPRLAGVAAAAVVLVGVGSAVLHQQRAREQELANTFRNFAGGLNVVADQPKPEAIVAVFEKDFEAIRRLPMASVDVDYTLLSALQME